ncbi:glycosyltransferase family 4 protein [Alkalibacillus almallahensis]|uniref:glycosyltransferase family 4 protein n=1 Tax=Alkalibacillus almallahensis TaxID=1379154 RepID=UPI0014232873|nr:glycosyltransferase family 4 protein [Alkalibacillus almallahensis]NIK11799.1 glycosyltransferase involved in cell wall biosynthesis [Alkalibacillus almallahensis]
MNVLFLMLNYPYDPSREHMYKDLSRKFAEQGHNVYVAALLEHKNADRTFVQEESNHKILWINAGDYFGVNKFKKGLTAIQLPLHFNKAIKDYFSDVDFDLIIYPTPAITLYYTVKKLKKKHPNAEYLLVVKDIFPQNAVDIGMMDKNIVYKAFRYIEKKLYQTSDYLGCMSQGNINYIQQNNNVDKSKFFKLENWSSVYNVERLESTQAEKIKQKYGIDKKFVLTFGGNISPANELEFLVKLAERLKLNGVDDVHFLIIGKGIAKEKIKNLVLDKKLDNISLFDFVPTEEYDQLLKLSDIGLVNLNRNYTIPNIPSKTLNLMRLGIPVLAATDVNTDYRKLIEEEARCGLWSETGDIDIYYNNLMKLRSSKDLRDELSINGRNYFENHLTTDKAYKNIIEKVED